MGYIGVVTGDLGMFFFPGKKMFVDRDAVTINMMLFLTTMQREKKTFN